MWHTAAHDAKHNLATKLRKGRNEEREQKSFQKSRETMFQSLNVDVLFKRFSFVLQKRFSLTQILPYVLSIIDITSTVLLNCGLIEKMNSYIFLCPIRS
jgi:hypothetical protein